MLVKEIARRFLYQRHVSKASNRMSATHTDEQHCAHVPREGANSLGRLRCGNSAEVGAWPATHRATLIKEGCS